uniref:AlNc14C298G10340 protein n=1 Tax=Albugo laibachii Nc14 TaxID=890382 RepID=F0WVK5_9STRA|nr:AlNc14C298G10340 [Albugo laibachii Nc14]|eukprot:CCA25447.1 AlNc14C298G10340 [Albugo laibachii Nc14]
MCEHEASVNLEKYEQENRWTFGKSLVRGAMNRLRPQRHRSTSISLHKTSDATSLSTNSGRFVNAVVIKYGTTECLVCLTLMHEIILLSITNAYAWMIEPQKEALGCECMAKDWKEKWHKFEHFNIHSLRPIPSHHVLHQVRAASEGKNT